MSGRKGAPRPKLETNAVIETLDALKAAAKGQTALVRELGISVATIARWRFHGRVSDAQHLIRLVELAERNERKRWALARRLAGLDK